MPALTIKVRGRVRNRWMLRIGLWFIGRCTVEVFADGKSVGKRRLVDASVVEMDEP